MTKTKRHMMVLIAMALAGLLWLSCWAQDAPALVAVYPSGLTSLSIQEAIDSANAYDTIVIREGTYHENVVIGKPLTLIGLDDVLIVPIDRILPVILIDETEGVVIHNIGIEDADTGIKLSQSSATIKNCRIQADKRCVDIVGKGSIEAHVSECTFGGNFMGVTFLANGAVEIVGCEFKRVSVGVFLVGMTSAMVYDCSFELCGSGVMLASSVLATVVGNRMDDTLLCGIFVAGLPPGAPQRPLVLVENTIRNCGQWGISLCTYNSPFDLTFEGAIQGFGNIIEGGHGYGPLCPTDYEWPVGFLAEDE